MGVDGGGIGFSCLTRPDVSFCLDLSLCFIL